MSLGSTRKTLGLVASALLLSGWFPEDARGQSQYSTTDGDITAAACHGSEVFYSINAYPYFNNDDYIFDANPFVLAKWTSPSSGIYRSTRGYSLVDMSGRKIWRDARVAANCYEFNAGITRVHFTVITAILGLLVDRSTACNDSGPNKDYAALQYDPYADPESEPGDCPDGSGSGGTDQEGGGCRIEWLVVEISYDGGDSWHTLWEGYGKVC